MLTILQNGQQVNVDFTVENNLIPTVEELKPIIKDMLCLGGIIRSNTNMSQVTMSQYLGNYHLYPGLLENGCIELYDENDKLIGNVDLYNTYSGTDTTRGTININESSSYIFNDKIKSKIVVDFPTQAANGNIKKLKLHSRSKYNSINNQQFNMQNVTTNIIFSGDNRLNNNPEYNYDKYNDIAFGYDNNQNYILINKALKKIFYKDLIYQYNDNFVGKIFFINDKFYILSSTDSNKFILKNIVLDDINSIAQIGTEIITLPYQGSNYNYLYNVFVINNIYYSFYQNNSTMYVIKYKSDFSSDKSIYYEFSNYYSFSPTAIPINDDNCVYYKCRYNNYIYLKINIVDMSITTITQNDYNLANNKANLVDKSISTNGENIDFVYRDYRPFIIRKSSPYKTPLTITLTNPITKTSEQTLKLILDINIQ